VEEGLDEVVVVGAELRMTEEEVVGREVFLEVVGLPAVVLEVVGLSAVVLACVVVACCVLFDDDDDEPSGQNVINRLALASWHAIWTQVSSGCLKAVLQLGESHVVPTPSQPP